MERKFTLTLIAISLCASAIVGTYLWYGHDALLTLRQRFNPELFDTLAAKNKPIQVATQPTEKVLLLSKKRSTAPTLSTTRGSILYYEKDTGRVLDVDVATGTEKVISDVRLENFITTLWSPTKKEVISLFKNTKTTELRYYNYLTKKSATMENVVAAAFSPDGSQVVYHAKDGSQNAIFLGSPDGAASKKLFTTRMTQATLTWPSEKTIALIVPGPKDEARDLLLLRTDGSLTKIIDYYPELETMWSQNGRYILFSYRNKNTTRLSYMDIQQGNEVSLPLNTRASKCGWSIDNVTVYCGVPRTGTTSSGQADDIVALNLAAKTTLPISKEVFGTTPVTIQQLLVSTNDDYLVFINGVDEKLYSLKIKK